MSCLRFDPLEGVSRRDLLSRMGAGFGGLALAALLAEETTAADRPLAPKAPHFTPRAKRVLHIYLNGGPSQIDTWDPKPLLKKYAGQPLPGGNLTTERKTGAALPSPFKFDRYGRSGLEISEIFARTAAHADDLCIIRSMHANTPNHEQSMRLMNCGDERLSRPSMGAWITYGLGSENENLPGYIALCPGLPVADVSNWRSAFLPGIYQGAHIDTRRTEVRQLLENIQAGALSAQQQRQQLDLLKLLNNRHRQTREDEPALEARIESYELAFRMQSAAMDAFDISKEPAPVRERYGDTEQGKQLLIARRLLERGVRFVQAYHGDVQPWDSHENIEANHRKLANECDGGIAALLADLKERDMLRDTLVICGGEFGRTPAVELANGKPANGRDHNHWGFSIWLAGGGVRGGMAYGATDEWGFKAAENPVHIHDLHATILHLLGFDHTRLTYRFAGRDFRLTDVHGNLVKPILA